MSETAGELRERLLSVGISEAAIEQAWPDWWVPEAEGSTSARLELRFTLARRLRLVPASLLGSGKPVVSARQARMAHELAWDSYCVWRDRLLRHGDYPGTCWEDLEGASQRCNAAAAEIDGA